MKNETEEASIRRLKFFCLFSKVFKLTVKSVTPLESKISDINKIAVIQSQQKNYLIKMYSVSFIFLLISFVAIIYQKLKILNNLKKPNGYPC